MFYDSYSNPINHQQDFPTEACFQMSNVIKCNGDRDIRKCRVCDKQWEDACNFEDNFS